MPHPLDGVTSELMRERLAKRFAADPAYRILHFLLGPDRVLEWAHSIGVATDQSLAECVPVLPPVHLRSITAETDPALFLFTGFHDCATLLELYRKHRGPMRHHKPAVLDFGCGPGRMTRFLDPSSWEIVASDVNPDHVAWCREHLRTVDTHVNGWAPPLPFEDARFDFIYSLSIFSHLSRPMLTAWLAELARVVRPGGVVALTFHGVQALQIIARSTAHQGVLHLTSDEARDIEDRLSREHVVLCPYSEAEIRWANVGAPEYGTTFIEPGFFLAASGRHFEPLAHLAAGLRGFQDIIVLRRPAHVEADGRLRRDTINLR